MVSGTGLTVALVIQIVGYVLFLKGFFPPKVVLLEFNSFLGSESPFEDVGGGPQFDHLIVMVVDAMRSDFMYGPESNMTFLHSLIERGNAIPLTAFSNPPTVTLPRLKGITTGGTPSFIDAILNVADDNDNSQSLSNIDSWIHQFKNLRGGRRIHFFGDDTWLKLFTPSEFFERFEGTSSFFVSDFTEVDNNVTRHLNFELNNDDWDCLILHYLGLDHIGHKGGPRSSFMQPKQIEMDDILKEIYLKKVELSQSTFMVLMGDHGMNDVGNHGGSSPGETSPGMVLISPRFQEVTKGTNCPVSSKANFDYYSLISQIDLVPTLAALFNFPIPKNNLGVIIPEVLDLWKSEDAKRTVLMENCEQFLGLLREKYSETEAKYKEIIQEVNDLRTDETSLQDIINYLRNTQSLLTASATNYSYFEIAWGTILISVSVLMISTLLFYYLAKGSQMTNTEAIMFPAFCIFYALHFHGSSLIEEEHQIWWFLMITNLTFFIGAQKFQGIWRLLPCLICIRIIKGWNDSGQKYISPFTISSILLDSPNLLWLLVITTYFIITGLLFIEGDWVELFGGERSRRFKSNDISSLCSFTIAYITASLSFLFKLCQYYNDGNEIPRFLNFFLDFVCDSFGSNSDDDKTVLQSMNIQISRLFTVAVLGIGFFRVIIGKIRGLNDLIITDLMNITTLILMHQSRVEIIPIFLVFTILRLSFAKFSSLDFRNNADLSLLLIGTFILCIQNLSFFSVGNTNLLATVDLSNAYNGLSSYNLILVGILTFVSNYAMPIYWSFAGLKILFEDGSPNFKSPITRLVQSRMISRKRVLITKCLNMLFFYGVSMLNLVGSCINLRYHLFIWSVFCPKLLYFSSWAILMNFGVDFVICFIITALK